VVDWGASRARRPGLPNAARPVDRPAWDARPVEPAQPVGRVGLPEAPGQMGRSWSRWRTRAVVGEAGRRQLGRSSSSHAWALALAAHGDGDLAIGGGECLVGHDVAGVARRGGCRRWRRRWAC
jgi:hypothetical protein